MQPAGSSGQDTRVPLSETAIPVPSSVTSEGRLECGGGHGPDGLRCPAIEMEH